MSDLWSASLKFVLAGNNGTVVIERLRNCCDDWVEVVGKQDNLG
ncbi:MAG: hypothetical protein OQL18_03150 [Deltaproteobacteria bacterium]|nr:hypothetical protein [Deltaproteobacteria bacterium]